MKKALLSLCCAGCLSAVCVYAYVQSEAERETQTKLRQTQNELRRLAENFGDLANAHDVAMGNIREVERRDSQIAEQLRALRAEMKDLSVKKLEADSAGHESIAELTKSIDEIVAVLEETVAKVEALGSSPNERQKGTIGGLIRTEPQIFSWPHDKKRVRKILEGFHDTHKELDRIIFDMEEFPVEQPATPEPDERRDK